MIRVPERHDVFSVVATTGSGRIKDRRVVLFLLVFRFESTTGI